MMRSLSLLALVVPALMLAGCEVGTKIVDQVGPRGTGLDLVAQKSRLPTIAPVPAPPYELTAEMRQGARAKDVLPERPGPW